MYPTGETNKIVNDVEQSEYTNPSTSTNTAGFRKSGAGGKSLMDELDSIMVEEGTDDEPAQIITKKQVSCFICLTFSITNYLSRALVLFGNLNLKATIMKLSVTTHILLRTLNHNRSKDGWRKKVLLNSTWVMIGNEDICVLMK